MRLFLNGFQNTSNSVTPINPTNITYNSKRTTQTGSTQTGHIQGIAIDDSNDRVFISYTSGVVCYKWSDLSFLYQTSANDIDNGTGASNGTHIGDIAIHNGFLYGGNALDFFYKVSPARNVVHEWNLNDLTINRSVESEFPHALGAFGSDGNKLYAGYGDELVSDGILQSINLTTLTKSGDNELIIPKKTGSPTDEDDFGNGIQAFSFFNNGSKIAFSDYNMKDGSYTGGSNLKIADVNTKEYIKFRDNTQGSIYDYGVDVIGEKLYIIQKANGSGNSTTDILEFDIISS